MMGCYNGYQPVLINTWFLKVVALVMNIIFVGEYPLIIAIAIA